MKLMVFSVRDKAVGAFLPPIFQRARLEAIRAFTQAVSDVQNSNIAKWPADYDLFYLGEWDDNDGMFTLEPSPVRVIGALEVKASLDREVVARPS